MKAEPDALGGRRADEEAHAALGVEDAHGEDERDADVDAGDEDGRFDRDGEAAVVAEVRFDSLRRGKEGGKVRKRGGKD